MAGDLNQAVRALSRKGDAPWKRMNGIQLDFKGRVRYIEKNYRNSKEIGEYIAGMLQHMNNRLSMLDLINSLEYEYNSFKVGSNPTIALNVQTGVNRMEIKARTIAAVKEIAHKYRISYSDIAVLFPFRQVPYHNYRFLYWLKQGLDDEGIPYSMIINEDNNMFIKKRQGDISGVVISTIESSLGLDFKAVVLSGLFPYSYVNNDGVVGPVIKTWSGIKAMDVADQTAVQSQMRAIYTACSRARDVLYVISDLKTGTPMEEIIRKNADRASLPVPQAQQRNTGKTSANGQSVSATLAASDNEQTLPEVVDHVTVKATIQETKKETTVMIDLAKYPKQKGIIEKKVGETFKLDGVPLTYKINRIIPDGVQIKAPSTSQPDKAPQPTTNTASLKAYFREKGFEVVDYRPNGGCLWVIGEKKQLEPYVLEAARLFRANGAYGSGKATSYKAGWWTKSNR